MSIVILHEQPRFFRDCAREHIRADSGIYVAGQNRADFAEFASSSIGESLSTDDYVRCGSGETRYGLSSVLFTQSQGYGLAIL